jgi:tetratricopeptide (TPR) repeat protein
MPALKSPVPLTRLSGTLLALVAATVSVSPVWASPFDTPTDAVVAGQELLDQARRVADPLVLVEAERAFQEAVNLAPDNADAHVGLATVALSRHRFAEALEIGRTAQRLAPESAQPLGVLFDASIELGRYDEARTIIEDLLLTRPDLPSLSRLSYYQELHGRLDLAIEAMERAVVAGSADAEHTAFAGAALGHLWLLEGDAARAARLFRDVLDSVPGYVPALVGTAQAFMAAGDTPAAIEILGQALEANREPAVLVQLGEALEATGDEAAAGSVYRDAVVSEAAHRATGEAPEPFGAVLETDHGDPALALTLAQRAYDHAPSIGAADALAWAALANGDLDRARSLADEALRTGTIDPAILYHAGVIAAATGQTERAEELLSESLARSAAGSPGLRARVEAALEAAGV